MLSFISHQWKEIKSKMRLIYTRNNLTKNKNSAHTKCWWECRSTGIFIHSRWANSWNYYFGKLSFSTSVEHKQTLWSSNSTARCINFRRVTHIHQESCRIIILLLIVIAPNYKQYKCPVIINRKVNCRYRTWYSKNNEWSIATCSIKDGSYKNNEQKKTWKNTYQYSVR